MKTLVTLLLLLSSFHVFAQQKNEHAQSAIDYYEKENFPDALKQIDIALGADSLNTDFLFVKGNILQKLRRYDQAFIVYSKIIQLKPDDAATLNQRGLMFHTIQEFDYAIQDYSRALELKNNDTIKLTLYMNRGVSKNAKRDFTGAYDDYLAGFKIDSLNIGILNNLATVCDEVGKGDQTLGYLYRIIQIDSTFVGAIGNIGFKHQEMGEYKTAIFYFDKVLKIDANEPLAYNNRGFCKYKLGDYTGALDDVNSSIALYTTNSFAFKNRALIYLAIKNFRNACEDLDKALYLGFTKMYGDEVETLKRQNCNKKLL